MTQLSTLTVRNAECDTQQAVAQASDSLAVRTGSLSWTIAAVLGLLRAATRRGQRKTLILVGLLPAGLALGYLFYFGCAAGFFICKACGGAEEGIQGRVRSIIIPLRTHELHLHHWLLSVVATVASVVHGFFLFAPGLFYGILGGLILQGILCYGDWHRIFKRRSFLSVFDEPDSISA